MARTPRSVLLATAISLAFVSVSCSTTPGVGGGGRTGIRGKVTVGPACPVQRADSPCPDNPYRARIFIRDAEGKIVTSFISNADGTFSIDLAPGRYTLDPQNGNPLPRAERIEVTVVEGTYARVDVAYDSGIR